MSIPSRPRVVITGAGGGLGRAFAKLFAERGATALLADVDPAAAESTRALSDGIGGRAYAAACDVSKPGEVEALVGLAEDKLGGVDVVVNNAGVAVAGPVGEVPLSDWDWIMGVNLWGVVYGCHFFTPTFKRQGSGHFINIASMAAIAQAPNMAPYNVTKAGVVALSETLYAELRFAGVGVTVVCPSFFQTNIMNAGRTTNMPGDPKGFVQKLMQRSRVQADDVAAHAVRAAERGQLYALPHREGVFAWGVKRLVPQLFHGGIVARASKRTLG
jgi:NAD(P)-dependent dehydrogenase (short-subunit alcohol dehydrogenase family)